MHASQILGLYLNRQATAGGGTMATEFGGIFRPGGDIVEIGVLPWYVQHDVLFFEKLHCSGKETKNMLPATEFHARGKRGAISGFSWIDTQHMMRIATNHCNVYR